MKSIGDLISDYSEKYHVGKAEADKAVRRTVSVMEDAIISEDNGFRIMGSFAIEKAFHKEHKGRDPHTNTDIIVPASVGIKVKCGAKLKERLN